MAQQYELTIKAEGEVRDADGNLISNEPLQGQTVITEEQAQRLLKQLEQQDKES